MLEFKLVHEALRERRLLLTRLAPHLVRPVEFLFPLRHRGWERPYMGAGLLLYDMWAGRHLPRARHLSRRAALEAAPALRPDSLIGAVQLQRRPGGRRPLRRLRGAHRGRPRSVESRPGSAP